MRQDKMKELSDRVCGDVKIPEGLEERLSATIDRLAAEETAADILRDGRTVRLPDAEAKPRKAKRVALKWASIAAAFVLVAGSAAWIVTKQVRSEPEDTCANVEEAKAETEKALNLIAAAFDKGMSQADESAAKIAGTTERIENKIGIKVK